MKIKDIPKAVGDTEVSTVWSGIKKLVKWAVIVAVIFLGGLLVTYLLQENGIIRL